MAAASGIPRLTKEYMVILPGYMNTRKVAKVCDVNYHTVNRVKHLSFEQCELEHLVPAMMLRLPRLTTNNPMNPIIPYLV